MVFTQTHFFVIKFKDNAKNTEKTQNEFIFFKRKHAKIKHIFQAY